MNKSPYYKTHKELEIEIIELYKEKKFLESKIENLEFEYNNK